MYKLILSASLLATIANAADPISKGDKAPYDGVIFNHKEAIDLKRDLIDLDTLKKQQEIYKENQKIMDNQVKLWRDQSLGLSKELVKEKNSFWGSMGYFFLGVGASTLIVFGVRRSLE